MSSNISDQLSRAQIIEALKAADRVVEKVEIKSYDSYKPHDEGKDGGQLAFHKAAKTHTYRVIAAGNRFGKSVASVNEMKWLATGTHPYRQMPIPNKGIMYGESFSWLSKVFEPKVMEWVNPNLLDSKKPFVYNNQNGLVQINWACGSVTYVGTYEQNIKKAEGTDLDYVGYDEPPTRKLWVANVRGLVDRKGIAWIAATPLSEPWIYDELWLPGLTGEKPHVKCISGKSSDNPNLPDGSLDLYFSDYTEEERRVRYHGEFATLSGLVINTYNPMISDIDDFVLDENFAIYEGIDPHSHKPHAVLWKAIDRDGFRFVCNELSFEGNMENFASAIMENRNKLERYGATVVKSVIDSSINQKDFLTRQNLFSELKKHLRGFGSKIESRIAIKGKGSLEDTITKLKDLYRPSYLKFTNSYSREQEMLNDPYSPEIYGQQVVAQKADKNLEIKVPMQYVFKSCKKYKKELQRYRWPKDSADKDTIKPVDDNNEFISCDRYIEQLKPKYHILGDRFSHTYSQRDRHSNLSPRK